MLRGCRNKTPLPKSGDHVAALPGAGQWASGSVETGRLGRQDCTVGGQQAPWACMRQLHGPWAPWGGTGHHHRSARMPFAGSRVGAGCLRQPKLRSFCLEGRLVPSLFTSRRRESRPSCVVCTHVWTCACAPCACLRVSPCVPRLPACPVCVCLRVPRVCVCLRVRVPACAPCACAPCVLCAVCACLRVPRVHAPHAELSPLTHADAPGPDPSRGSWVPTAPRRAPAAVLPGRVSV